MKFTENVFLEDVFFLCRIMPDRKKRSAKRIEILVCKLFETIL